MSTYWTAGLNNGVTNSCTKPSYMENLQHPTDSVVTFLRRPRSRMHTLLALREIGHHRRLRARRRNGGETTGTLTKPDPGQLL